MPSHHQSNTILCLVLVGCLLVSCCGNEVRDSNEKQQQNSLGNVTIVGLGVMGQAVVKCLAQNGGYHVHAWNRGVERRNQVRRDFADLQRVTVHDSLQDAVASSPLIIMNIDGGNDANESAAERLIQTTVSDGVWTNKTLVQFSSHTPTAAKRQETLLLNVRAKQFVGGAMIAIPETLCHHETAVILASPGKDNNNDNDEKYSQVLNSLGRVIEYNQGDVGLASLANICIIQAMTFGIAGHEMAHLLMERYKGATRTFIQHYQTSVTQIVPAYIPMLFGTVSASIIKKQWDQSYVPSLDFFRLLEMHHGFMQEMGIVRDTYLEGYIRYLKKITNAKDGPSAWIQHAVVDDTAACDEEVCKEQG